MLHLSAFPWFLSVLVFALSLAALFSSYQGSLLIELTLPGGAARVQLDRAISDSPDSSMLKSRL